MTRREVLAWLAARRPVPPDALRAGIEAVVRDAELSPLDPVPDQLALLGRQMLERVAGRPGGGRELAIELLAADAFITYAFEAQAELDATGLAALAERTVPDRGARPCGSLPDSSSRRHPIDRVHPGRRWPGDERRGGEPDATVAGGQARARRRARHGGAPHRHAGDLSRRGERRPAPGGRRRDPRLSRRGAG